MAYSQVHYGMRWFAASLPGICGSCKCFLSLSVQSTYSSAFYCFHCIVSVLINKIFIHLFMFDARIVSRHSILKAAKQSTV